MLTISEHKAFLPNLEKSLMLTRLPYAHSPSLCSLCSACKKHTKKLFEFIFPQKKQQQSHQSINC